MRGRRRTQVSGIGLSLLEGALQSMGPDGGSPVNQRQTAEYLVDIILELRNLARMSKLYTVMVPLEYAYYEAFGIANRVEVSPEEVERIKTLSKIGEQYDQSA
jgi:hypothetical protein